MKFRIIIALIPFVLAATARAQEEAKASKSVAQLRELLKATIENNRTLATHVRQMSTELATVRKEMENLRSDIKKTTAERDNLRDQVVRLADQYHSLQGLLQVLKERNFQLAAQLAKTKEANGEVATKQFQVREDGVVVTAVSGGSLLVIPIGSDGAIALGTKLDVFRGTTYVGRVEVIVINLDQTVARPIAEFMKSTAQKGDRVSSRLLPAKFLSVEAPAEEPSE